MRFMMMSKANQDYEAGKPPPQALMEAMGRFTEEMTRAGHLIEAGGLLPSAYGCKIRATGGELRVIDGPFAEAKELIGGYAIVEARSHEEAIEFGRQFMRLHVSVLGRAFDGECEIRPMYSPDNAPCKGLEREG